MAERKFYGWWVVAALGVVLFNTSGFGFVFPLFIKPFQDEFDWTVTQVSIGMMLLALVSAFARPVVGALIVRYGARRVMIVSAALQSLVHLAYAGMQRLWMLYAIMCVSGIAMAGITNLPAQTTIIHWFDRYRGRAMSIVFVGASAGGFVLPQFNEFLIRTIGWRRTWVVSFAIAWVLVIPVTLLFVRDKPSDLDQTADGIAREPNGEGPAPATARGLLAGRAIRTQTFWLLTAIFVILAAGMMSLNFHMIPFLEQQAGFTSRQAAFYYGASIGISVFGRLLGGWIADRLKPHLVMAAAGLLMGMGPAMLELLIVRLELRDPNLLWAYAIPFGIGYGVYSIMVPILVGRCFGALHFPKIMGGIGMGVGIAIVIGIPSAGALFDRTGSYEIVIVACVVGSVISSILALLIRPDRYHSEFEEHTG